MATVHVDNSTFLSLSTLSSVEARDKEVPPARLPALAAKLAAISDEISRMAVSLTIEYPERGSLIRQSLKIARCASKFRLSLLGREPASVGTTCVDRLERLIPPLRAIASQVARRAHEGRDMSADALAREMKHHLSRLRILAILLRNDQQ
jgi:hypothetical protein